MRLAGTWQRLGQDLLARVRRVPSAAAVRVAADVAVRVADVVLVFLVEFVVGHELEGAPPEDDAFFQTEADAFEEERVLQTAVVLEVRVCAQRHVQVLHAEGEVLGECIDCAGVDGREAVDVGVGGGIGGFGGGKGLGEMGEDGCEAIVFV